MKKIIFTIVLLSLLFASVFQAAAQNNTNDPNSNVFDTTGFPQWAKDLRRWNIVSFGSFPFAMMAVTFSTDMRRWNEANGRDWSEEGRRYAPWPLKSAGAVEMTKDEYKRTIWLAVGLSATIGIADLVIVNIRRGINRRRVESAPTGAYTIDITSADTYTINITSYHEKIEEANFQQQIEEAVPEISGSETE